MLMKELRSKMKWYLIDVSGYQITHGHAIGKFIKILQKVFCLRYAIINELEGVGNHFHEVSELAQQNTVFSIDDLFENIS